MSASRLKRPPPAGSLCDAISGVLVIGRDPVLKRCDRPATVSMSGVAPFESWLCESCAEAIERKSTPPEAPPQAQSPGDSR